MIDFVRIVFPDYKPEFPDSKVCAYIKSRPDHAIAQIRSDKIPKGPASWAIFNELAKQNPLETATFLGENAGTLLQQPNGSRKLEETLSLLGVEPLRKFMSIAQTSWRDPAISKFLYQMQSDETALMAKQILEELPELAKANPDNAALLALKLSEQAHRKATLLLNGQAALYSPPELSRFTSAELSTFLLTIAGNIKREDILTLVVRTSAYILPPSEFINSILSNPPLVSRAINALRRTPQETNSNPFHLDAASLLETVQQSKVRTAKAQSHAIADFASRWSSERYRFGAGVLLRLFDKASNAPFTF